MQLTCPECQARYEVADNAIPVGGRTVRCANCGHSWLAELPPPKKQIPVDMPAPPQPVKTPAKPAPVFSEPATVVVAVTRPILKIAAPRPLKVMLAALTGLAILLSPFAYRKSILQNHPEFSFIFEPFGIYYMDGLALADMNITRTPVDDTKTRIAIDCSIINETRGSREVPEVVITLLNDEGKVVRRSPDMVETGKNMIPGALEPCKTYQFEISDDTIDRARVDLIDPFDRRLRK